MSPSVTMLRPTSAGLSPGISDPWLPVHVHDKKMQNLDSEAWRWHLPVRWPQHTKMRPLLLSLANWQGCHQAGVLEECSNGAIVPTRELAGGRCYFRPSHFPKLCSLSLFLLPAPARPPSARGPCPSHWICSLEHLARAWRASVCLHHPAERPWTEICPISVA